MSKVNDGGPAFPVPNLEHDEDFNGMALRDYFAAKALQGLISGWGAAAWPTKDDVPLFPEQAYELADLMLRAREK